jgi:hypothetical protein
MDRRVAVGLATLLTLASVGNTRAQSQPTPPVEPAEWAPADALFYLGITDVAGTADALQRMSAQASPGDASASDALSQPDLLGSAVEQLRGRLARVLGVQPPQLKNPFKGPLVLYVGQRESLPYPSAGSGSEGLEPGLIGQIGDAALARKYYDTIVGKLVQLGRHETVPAGANTIDLFTGLGQRPEDQAASEEDEFEALDREGGSFWSLLADGPGGLLKRALDRLFSPRALPRSLAMCLTEDRLVMAGSADQVKALLEQRKGERSLADTDDHQALLSLPGPIGTVRVLVNLSRIVGMVRASAAGDRIAAGQTEDLLKLLGTEHLLSLVGHLDIGAASSNRNRDRKGAASSASYEWKGELLLRTTGPPSGLVRILGSENRPVTPPPAVTDDVCVFSACNLSLPEVLTEVERLELSGRPDFLKRLSEEAPPTTLPSGEVFQLRRDFLDHLTGPLTFSFALTGPAKPGCVRALVTLGHGDRSAMLRFLQGLPGLLTPRDWDGTQVFDLIPIPAMMLPAGVSLAATSDRLMLGNTAGVESALRAPVGQSLSESQSWQNIARLVPAEASFVLYIDQRRMLDAVLELARHKDELAASQPAGMDIDTLILMDRVESLGPSVRDDLRRSTGETAVPPGVARIRQLAGQAIYTLSTHPNGVRLTAVQLRPE